MPPSQIVQQAEAARRLGVKAPYLSRLTKEGKIPRLSDGRYDMEQVRQALSRGRDPLRHSKANLASPQIIAHAQAVPAKPNGLPLVQIPVGAAEKLQLMLLSERTKREAALAEQEAMETRRRKGELVERAEVEAEQAELITICRSVLLAIPANLADKLAAETSPASCHELIEGEIYRALDLLGSR